MTDKTMTIRDILSTDKLLAEAVRLYEHNEIGSNLHSQLVKLIEPHMDEINKRLGQENDVSYLAYAVEYALMQATRRGIDG